MPSCQLGLKTLDVFVQGTNGAYFYKEWSAASDGHLTERLALPRGNFIGPPVVTSWGPDRMDVFGQSVATASSSTRVDVHGGWSPARIGSTRCVIIGPRGHVRMPNHIDVFAQGTDGAYWQIWCGDGNCVGSGCRAGPAAGGVFAACPRLHLGSDNVSLIGQGTNGSCGVLGWNGVQWMVWISAASSWTATVVSWDQSRRRFGQGTNFAYFHRGFQYARAGSLPIGVTRHRRW